MLRDTTLPSKYAQERERRRRSGQWIGLVILIGFGTSMGVKVGQIGIVIVVALVVSLILAVGAARWRIAMSMRSPHGERRLPAQLPAAVPRHAGQKIKPALKDSAEFFGKLDLSSAEITWTPSKTSGTKTGIAMIAWPTHALSGLKIVHLRNPLVPMCLLYFRDRDGSEVHMWVRRPSQYIELLLNRLEIAHID